MSDGSKARIHSVDYLRAFTMFAVLVMHACIPYIRLDMPDLIWVIEKDSPSVFLSWCFIVIRGFTMPTFFMLAGFWTARHYEVMGESRLIRFRVKRMLIPFAAGSFIILPLVYYIWSFGWLLQGRCHLTEVLLGKFSEPIMRNLYGPVHLWFLEYVLLMTAIYLAVKRLRPAFLQRVNPADPVKLKTLLIFLSATFVILALNNGAMFNFRNFILPDIFRLIHYGVFFIFGLALWRNKESLNLLAKRWGFFLAAACPSAFITGILLFNNAHQKVFLNLPLAFFGSVFSWSISLFLTGFFTDKAKGENGVIRWLSDSSYWVYLSHFPLVGLLQLTFYGMPLPSYAKFFLVTAGSLLLCLLSYQVFVRNTFVGAMLHTPKHQRMNKNYTPYPGKLFAVTAVLFTAVFYLSITPIHKKLIALKTEEHKTAVTSFYWKYFKRKPDTQGLNYWTSRAVDHLGVGGVEYEGFIRVIENRKKD